MISTRMIEIPETKPKRVTDGSLPIPADFTPTHTKPFQRHNNNGKLVFHHDINHAVDKLKRTAADPEVWSATSERTMLMGARFSEIVILPSAKISTGKLNYLQTRVAPGGKLHDFRPRLEKDATDPRQRKGRHS